MDKPAWSPGKLIGKSGYYWRSFTIHAAVKLGIFTAIGGEELQSEKLHEG